MHISLPFAAFLYLPAVFYSPIYFIVASAAVCLWRKVSGMLITLIIKN